ncbi:MAG: flagellar basal body rod C-terminal domain-containing protein [Desulfobacterales bacterium]|jgi:flagellar basal-body rod protein FlgC
MITGLSSALSSIQAHHRKMNVHANNTANVNTNGFKRDQAVIEEAGPGEVRVNVRKDMSSAPLDPWAPDSPDFEKELSNVDLADEMTGMISTEIGYKANLTTIRTRDEMIGTLLDTLA